MTTNALIIFIRNPELGKVKTRLAKDLGPEEALRIYLKLLGHTRKVAQSVPVDRYLFYSHFVDREDSWPGSDFKKFPQASGDLGDRMLQAFDQALSDSDAAVIVGSDCPGLNTAILETAFEQLKQHDFVIGPAMDGGYYLLGMKKMASSLFLNISWSTDQVFAETTGRMQALGATYYVLPTLSDIDYAADWEKYGPLID
jgi:hypothetical protein